MTLSSADLARDSWANARDSVRHALDHFSDMHRSADREHHTKWVILSVHHAAECFCHILLLQVGPGVQAFERRGKLWFPSLRDSVTLLTAGPGVGLTGGERRLLELFGHLADARDHIMHRTLPPDMEASIAAMSLLGLSRLAGKRLGEAISSIDDSGGAELSVFDSIHYMRVEEYCRIAERLVQEEYPDRYLPPCANCGTESIVESRCEVCFQDMDSTECPNCQMQVFYPSWQRRADPHVEMNCPHCSVALVVGSTTQIN